MISEPVSDRPVAERSRGIVLPPRKRFRGSTNLTRPFQTFRAMRKDAYDKAEYTVDESWPFEEERSASDALLVPAFVFTHSFHHTKGSANQSPPVVAHEMLWRCAGNGVLQPCIGIRPLSATLVSNTGHFQRWVTARRLRSSCVMSWEKARTVMHRSPVPWSTAWQRLPNGESALGL